MATCKEQATERAYEIHQGQVDTLASRAYLGLDSLDTIGQQGALASKAYLALHSMDITGRQAKTRASEQ